jgi:hypothetical protein
MKIYNWFSLPSQLSPNLRKSTHPNTRQICQSHTRIDFTLARVLHDPRYFSVRRVHRQNARKHPEQFPTSMFVFIYLVLIDQRFFSCYRTIP